SSQLAKNLPKTQGASSIAPDLQTHTRVLQGFRDGRGWDRTSDLPRVNRPGFPRTTSTGTHGPPPTNRTSQPVARARRTTCADHPPVAAPGSPTGSPHKALEPTPHTVNAHKAPPLGATRLSSG